MALRLVRPGCCIAVAAAGSAVGSGHTGLTSY